MAAFAVSIKVVLISFLISFEVFVLYLESKLIFWSLPIGLNFVLKALSNVAFIFE